MIDLQVLVTGAGGLVGSHAVRVLHENRYLVVALYRKLDERSARPPWGTVLGDLLDNSFIRTLGRVEFDIVVHCAAVLPDQFHGIHAEQAAQANLLIDERITSLCLEKGSRLVYLSGTSVYGMGSSSPLTEDADLSPIGPYVQAKVLSERRILDALAGASTVLRVSSPYGPGQRARTVLRLFIERSLADLDLLYHGSGKREQDFIAAYDLAKAILCSVYSAKGDGVFNIAGGHPISMQDLAELVVRTVPGTKSKALPSGQPDPQEGYRARFDTGKACRILGWRPTISLQEGILEWAEHLRGRR